MEITEQQLRESLQPMFKDELMRTWREGVRDGFKMAHNMAEATHNECLSRYAATKDGAPEARIALGAQIAAIRGLMGALLTAADEAVNPAGASPSA